MWHYFEGIICDLIDVTIMVMPSSLLRLSALFFLTNLYEILLVIIYEVEMCFVIWNL